MNEMALHTNKCRQHKRWRDTGSYHSNHPKGGYKNDIDVTIKCHQQLGKEAIYIYDTRLHEEVQTNNWFYTYSTNRALSYSFLVIWLCHRRLSGWYHTCDPFLLKLYFSCKSSSRLWTILRLDYHLDWRFWHHH